MGREQHLRLAWAYPISIRPCRMGGTRPGASSKRCPRRGLIDGSHAAELAGAACATRSAVQAPAAIMSALDGITLCSRPMCVHSSSLSDHASCILTIWVFQALDFAPLTPPFLCLHCGCSPCALTQLKAFHPVLQEESEIGPSAVHLACPQQSRSCKPAVLQDTSEH